MVKILFSVKMLGAAHGSEPTSWSPSLLKLLDPFQKPCFLVLEMLK